MSRDIVNIVIPSAFALPENSNTCRLQINKILLLPHFFRRQSSIAGRNNLRFLLKLRMVHKEGRLFWKCKLLFEGREFNFFIWYEYGFLCMEKYNSKYEGGAEIDGLLHLFSKRVFRSKGEWRKHKFGKKTVKHTVEMACSQIRIKMHSLAKFTLVVFYAFYNSNICLTITCMLHLC